MMLARCMAAALLLGFAACGGGSTSSSTKAVPSGGGKVSSSRAKADEAFATLSNGLLEKDDDGLSSDQLRAKLRDVLAIDPGHPAARFNLAVLDEKDGRASDAQRVYQELAKLNPPFVPAVENIAARYVSEGRVDDAMRLYRENLKRDPKNTTSRLGLARIKLSQREYNEAIKLAREVLQRKADAVEAFRILAQCYRAVKNTPMAELIIGRALKVAPKDVALHSLLADILLEQEQLAAGVGKLKEVITYDPENLPNRARFASIALRYRDYGNAAQQYEAILKQRPDDRATKLSLAVAYRGMGRYQQAQDLYQSVLSKNPQDQDGLWNLAILQHRFLSDFDGAITNYKSFEKVATPGLPEREQVGAMVADAERMKSDLAAMRAREAAEQARAEAIEKVCLAVQNKTKAQPALVGGEQERVETAWQLMVEAQEYAQQGSVAEADARVSCAFVVAPETHRGKVEACAPMGVMWTQILYQLGRLEDALTMVRRALGCDPENPDAQLIEQQLLELMAQEQSGAAG